jgi:hypothetical protein
MEMTQHTPSKTRRVVVNPDAAGLFEFPERGGTPASAMVDGACDEGKILLLLLLGGCAIWSRASQPAVIATFMHTEKTEYRTHIRGILCKFINIYIYTDIEYIYFMVVCCSEL